MDLFIIIFHIFLGVLVGTLTGLIPGLHPNTMCTLFIGFFFGEPFLVSVLIVSSAIAHSFLDFIPSIFLGAPDAGTAMGVLPGHNMMLKGEGYEAVRLTVIGGLVSLLIILVLLPFLMILTAPLYDIIRPNIHWILITLTGFMFTKDRKIWGPVVFGLSGLLGYIVLNGNFLGNFELLPMLTGLFGTSMILKSLHDEVKIPEQKNQPSVVGRGDMIKGGLVGSLSGILVGLLPGVGAAQATFISREILKDKTEKKFMIAIGGVNTVVAVFSILALWIIGKTRSGVAVAVNELLGNLVFSDVMIFLGAIVLSGGLSSILTIILAKKTIAFFRKINYKKASLSVILGLVSIVFVFTGLPGLFVLFLSTVIGLVTLLTNTRRSYMMACIIVPTVIYFI